jgi:competence protein ComEA
MSDQLISDPIKYRILIVILLALFGILVYAGILQSKENEEISEVIPEPLPEVATQPKSKINNVVKFNINDKLKINSASKEDIFARLKGIGPKTAQAIVDHRNRYGPFKSLDDLQAVKGIGPATIRDIEQQITFTELAIERELTN